MPLSWQAIAQRFCSNGILRGENDNATIGLLICKTKDNVLAQYATSMVNVPDSVK